MTAVSQNVQASCGCDTRVTFVRDERALPEPRTEIIRVDIVWPCWSHGAARHNY